MNLPENAKAKCPFYQAYHDREIQCESRIGRTRLVHSFYNSTEAIRHKRQYCDQYCWHRCMYAEVLLEVYKDGKTQI